MTKIQTKHYDSPDDVNFSRLMALYLEDDLNVEDMVALYHTLTTLSKRQRQFVDMCILHCHLAVVMKRPQPRTNILAGPDQVATEPAILSLYKKVAMRIGPRVLAVAAILCLLTVGAFMVLLLNQKAPQRAFGRVAIIYKLDKQIPHGRTLTLQSGILNISFASGAQVLVQAPAVYTLQSRTSLLLSRGKVVVKAVDGGFIVHTPEAAVRDLGTWFAVSVPKKGPTMVGVYEGHVMVQAKTVATAMGQWKNLTTGQAVRVEHGQFHDVGTAWRQVFVQSITSPGTLDLVDLLCGGNGTTHRHDWGINVTTGTAGPLMQIGPYSGDGSYHRVPALPVVDGCFVPANRRPIQIDSMGDHFIFHATRSDGYFLVWAGGTFPPFNSPLIRAVSPVLAGINYSQPPDDVLYLHPDKGLTLNLDAIRRLHPGSRVIAFQAVLGDTFTSSPAGTKVPFSSANVWVIVDGQVRFEKRGITPDIGAIQVDIPLRGSDHFLTIADTAVQRDYSRDWIIFGNPLLEMSPR